MATEDPPPAAPGQLPYSQPRLHALGARLFALLSPIGRRIAREAHQLVAWFRRTPPTVRNVFGPFLALVVLLYCRAPTTNYIFDEQEALLANPYVNQVGFRYSEAIYRDFWGLPANASIGSYRPVPNYLWRGLVELGERAQGVYDAHAPGWAKDKLAAALAPEPVPRFTDVMRRSWFQHLYNLVLHATCGAVFTAIAFRLTRRRLAAWLVGLTFVTAAILTEAVSGVVGLADVLGGLGALLALAALGCRAHVMPFAVFLAMLLGLFSKESAIVCVPLVPVAALLTAPVIHAERPARIARAALAAVGTVAAFVVYVELRKRWFPSSLPSEHSTPLPLASPLGQVAVRDFFVWFHQAPLPVDPLNNPLVDAPVDLRVGAALRVYFRGLVQVVFPYRLSGDYSFPQEPVPERMWFPESALGWLATVLPLGAALGIWVVALRREAKGERADEAPSDDEPEPAAPTRFARLRAAWGAVRRPVLEAAIVLGATALAAKMLAIGPSPLNKDLGDPDPSHIHVIPPWMLQDALVYAATGCLFFGALTEALWKRREHGPRDWRLPALALGLVWIVVSYFPHSNMVVILPTVRAERLWYFPVIGTSIVLALALLSGFGWLRRRGLTKLAWAMPAMFLTLQAGRAYLHATDYRDDLTFWRATKEAVPNSAKAHLNYSVMVGARGYMDTRLAESEIAKRLAPKWAMAHIYTGDTLCRMGRPEQSWPHYAEGFALGPNDKGLIALALQCLFDTKQLAEHDDELRTLIADHPGSWLAYLGDDLLENGEKQGGVLKDHRPRSYNEGPKEE